MSIDTSVFATEEAAIAADLPATFLFEDGNQTVIGMAGEATYRHTLVEEGFQGESDFEFRGLVSRFSSKPSLNSIVTDQTTGNGFRIESLKTGPDNLTYIFGLVSLTK